MPDRPLVNDPSLWQNAFPWPQREGNKYSRGSVLVFGGQSEMTGAAKLAAAASLRIGAGLATIACPKAHLPLYTHTPLAVMIRCYESDQELYHLYNDKKYTTLLLGPGAGATEPTKHAILAALETKKPLILDADGISVFANDAEQLAKHLQAPTILTPHEGEFKRLFALSNNREQSVLDAASSINAVIVLKGHDTLIADPKGNLVINNCAPPTLATAGTGDVLSGLCAGLLANNIPPFHAACIAVWIHSQAANFVGHGLIADDLLLAIPEVLKGL